MATIDRIDTVEDLVRILDENPEWLEAIRSRLLTKELLEMPNTLAGFMESTNQRFEQMSDTLDRFMESTNQRFEDVDRRFEQMSDTLDRFMESTNQRFEDVDRRFEQMSDTLDRFIEATNQRFEQIDRRFEDVDRRFEQMSDTLAKFMESANTRFESLERAIQQLRDDISPLKAAHARDETSREFDLIAEDMGLEPVRIISLDEIRAWGQSLRASGISRGQFQSFRRADLIVEARDSQDETCYIAVEVSFTADTRDTTRAARNARFISQVTGKVAYAAFAGLRRDNETQPAIDSGEVYWYALDPDTLEVE